MLAHAESCGGENGKRYTATAICACVHEKRWNSPETLQALHGLALTWVTHLLFVFRCGNHSQRTPSDIATPTIDDTSTFMDTTSGARHRRDGLRDEILKRDGYQCVVTELREIEHPLYKHLDHPDPRFRLEACHILRRATAVFGSGRDNSSYISATSTFDILRNYASLSEQVINNLKDVIDAPSNAILLAPQVHHGWDIFKWCLKPTETPNKYIVKSFGAASGLYPNQMNRIVVFRDRSAEFEKSSSRKRKAPDIDLPDTKFIAIHAAIAEILHMSGAGRFFDELFRKFGPSGESSPVGCWEDFEMMVRDAKLTKSCEQVIHVP
ncbi:hypothetical protein F5887DRAFT_357699 [Amanita rubescens]|nr:hypothetical protein F5887DRAFT_357699 [Amanita rubescens]